DLSGIGGPIREGCPNPAHSRNNATLLRAVEVHDENAHTARGLAGVNDQPAIGRKRWVVAFAQVDLPGAVGSDAGHSRLIAVLAKHNKLACGRPAPARHITDIRS